MKRSLAIALCLSLVLSACRTKYVYENAPQQNNNTPQPATDNQPYQAPPTDYTSAPVQQTTQQQPVYNQNNNGSQTYNNDQNNNNQQYNDQYNQENSQQYYEHQQQVNYAASSYQTFYDDLAPYGSWVSYPAYGYVWVPAQGPGFRPYATNGHWVYTDYGWTWVSGYSWGWATFHYGTWAADPEYGWIWVPGNTWAPAWVTWGQCNGYYGWAPVGPNVNAYNGYRPPVDHWNFVPQAQITEVNINNYVVNHNTNTTIINNNTTNITVINNNQTYNNVRYDAGPPSTSVEAVTGHKVQKVTIQEAPKPSNGGNTVNNNNLSVYRPAITQATATRAAPAVVVPLQNVKAVNSSAVKGVIPIQQRQSPAPIQQKQEPIHINPALRPNNGTQQSPIERKPMPVESKPIERQAPTQSPIESKPIERPATPQAPIQRQPMEPKPIEQRPVAPQAPVESKPIERSATPQVPVQRLPESRPIERQPIQQAPKPAQPQQPIRQQQQPKSRPQQQPKPAPRPVQHESIPERK